MTSRQQANVRLFETLHGCFWCRKRNPGITPCDKHLGEALKVNAMWLDSPA